MIANPAEIDDDRPSPRSSPPPRSPRDGRILHRLLRLAPLAIFVAHVAGLLAIFDPVVGAFDASPILEQDWGTHFFHVASREAFEREGRESGYNPWFMGGYVSNTIHDASIRLFEAAAVKLAGGVRFVTGDGTFDAWRAFKWIAFAFAASIPLAGAAAGRALAGECRSALRADARAPSTSSSAGSASMDSMNGMRDMDGMARMDSMDGVDLVDGAGAGARADLAAALLSGLWTLSWWNSLPREMFFYGMVGFATAPFFGVWAVAAVARAMTPPSLPASPSRPIASYPSIPSMRSIPSIATLFVLLAILPAMHLQAAILAGPSAAFLWIAGVFRPARVAHPASRASARRAALVAGVVLLAALVNAPWLATFLRHAGDGAARELVEAAPVFTTRPGDWFRDYFTAEGLWTFRTTPFEKGLRWALVVGAVASCVAAFVACRHRRRDSDSTDDSDDSPARNRLALSLWIGVLWCGWLAYFGSSFESIRAWQPLRFKVGMDLFLAALVAMQLPFAFVRSGGRMARSPETQMDGRMPISGRLGEPTYVVGSESRPTSPRVAPSAFVAIAALALGLACAVVAILVTEFPRDPSRSMRVRTRFHPTIHRLIERIENDTPPDARVLFEVSGDESGFAHDGSYLSAFLPSLAGRACIGGPANLYNDRRQSINFVAGRLLGRPVESIPPRELETILDAYAIGSAVVFTEESRRALEALPGRFRAVATVGPFVLLADDTPPGWFASDAGAAGIESVGGKVALDWNRIECRDVRPGPDGRAILKCNWAEGLVCDPPAALEPARVRGAREPFVAIRNPPASFTLRVRAE